MKRRSAALFLLLSLLIGLFSSTAFAQQPILSVPVLVANTSFLNIRSGDGPQYTVLVTVVGGTELQVLGSNKSKTWYLVTTPIGPGWVDLSYTIPRGNFSIVPVLAPTASATVSLLPPPLSIGLPGSVPDTTTAMNSSTTADNFNGTSTHTRAVLNVLSVNLRTQPSDNAAAITTLFQNGTIDYEIVGTAYDANNVPWVAIVVPDIGTGWVEMPKVTTRLSGAYATVGFVNVASIDLLAAPGSDTLRLPTLYQGQEIFIIGTNANGQEYQVQLANGVTGYLPVDKVTIRLGTPTDGTFNPQTVGINATTETTTAFGPPNPTSSIPIPVLEAPHIIVNTSFQNVRSGPGNQYSVIATVAGGESFVPLGVTKDFSWYLIRGDFGQGWISSDYVLFRGTFSNVPIIYKAF